MTESCFVLLAHRGVIQLTGPDARGFLQGLISNDVTRVGADRAIYAGFLTPQGKFLHDFFLAAPGESAGAALLIDCEGERLADLARRLQMFKLRSKVVIEDASPRFAVAAAIGSDALGRLGLPAEPGRAIALTQPSGAAGVAYVDPRLAAMGARLILPRADAEAILAKSGLAAAGIEAYDRLRLELGLPDGSRDMEIEKAILLENGFDELHGIDWKKGCYMGQELTARTKYRGLIRKRLMPVTVDGPLPVPGTPVMMGDQEAGEMRSGRDGRALALLRLDAVESAAKSGAALVAGTAKLTPIKPSWASY